MILDVGENSFHVEVACCLRGRCFCAENTDVDDEAGTHAGCGVFHLLESSP